MALTQTVLELFAATIRERGEKELETVLCCSSSTCAHFYYTPELYLCAPTEREIQAADGGFCYW